MATTKVSTKLLETVGIAEGGTGATSAGAARTALGIAAGASDAEAANIMLNAFRISVNGSLTRQNMVDGVVDEFEDETGIDTANSTNEAYNSTDDDYGSRTAQVAFGTGTVIGNFGTRLEVTADGDTTKTISEDAQHTNNTDTYAGKDWGSGVTYEVNKFIAYAPSNSYGFVETATPVEFTLQGSTDNFSSSVVTLYNNASITSAAGTVTTVDSGITSGTAYRYHRLKIHAVSAKAAHLAELELFVVQTTVDITLLSNSTTALAAPSDANLVLWQQDVDSVTLNTDLLAWVTREAGQTFTTDFGTDEKLDISTHGFSNDDRVMVTSSSQDLPAGSDSATVYYVVNKTTNDFELSLTSGGSAINITDNGTGTHTARRWVQVTLAKEAALTTGQILTGTADVSGLTSGTTMRYALVTDNTKNMNIHAVALQWS